MSRVEPKREHEGQQRESGAGRSSQQREQRQTPSSGVGHTPSKAEGDEATVNEALRRSSEN